MTVMLDRVMDRLLSLQPKLQAQHLALNANELGRNYFFVFEIKKFN